MPAKRAVVDGEAEQLDAEPAAAMLRQDEHVGEVRVHVPVGHGAREPDERLVVVEADHARRAATTASVTSRVRPAAQ